MLKISRRRAQRLAGLFVMVLFVDYKSVRLALEKPGFNSLVEPVIYWYVSFFVISKDCEKT